jgi:hypothetical protein
MVGLLVQIPKADEFPLLKGVWVEAVDTATDDDFVLIRCPKCGSDIALHYHFVCKGGQVLPMVGCPKCPHYGWYTLLEWDLGEMEGKGYN